MTQTYTIEAAPGSIPIDPRYLRELRDLIRGHEDLDLGVRLRDRPPAPGEQGAIPVALEIVQTAAPLGTALAAVLIAWMHKHKVTITVRHRGDDLTYMLTGLNARDAQQVLADLERGKVAGRGHDD